MNKTKITTAGMFISIALFLILLFSSCKKDNPIIPPIEPPPVVKDTVTISVEGTTHRSIALRVQSTVNDSSLKIRLFRTFSSADTLAAEYPILVKDTTIIDDNSGEGLQLNTEYTYYAVTVDTAGEIKDTSNTISVKTLAPTSHNYTWQEYTIGDFGSALYDVWGIDENNVYAVGGVTINDTVYGVLHWDGSQWEPEKRIGGLQAIFGFSKDDIWSVGGGIWRYNGTQWYTITESDPVLNNNTPYTSIWGTSSSDMYLGSTWGKIIHWDGTKAEVMNVHSNVGAFLDIWGFSENDIYAVAGDVFQSLGELYHFDGVQWEIIRTGGPNKISYDTYGPFSSVWGINPSELYLQGNDLEVRRGNSWVTDFDFGVYTEKIRGSAGNNLFACGHFGLAAHYNGVDWKIFNGFPSIILRGVYVTENKVFIVGNNTIYEGVTQ